ncbi:hypothetical protein B9479_003860 [Cryptococcus floricola]|uniref:Carboxylic ester hydrolase n=1 Tax=Cryptococcus floricola TaxID=2591691 RepID=A0A5D3AZK0_9TREE|nr:hypothetical protein B9479_003860 [Cryptococcus floricola]
MRLQHSFVALGLLCSSSAASPLYARQNETTSNATSAATAPTATIYPDTSQGQPIEIVGTTYPNSKTDAYLGIPFAKPPIDNLRFAPPEAYTYNTSSYAAQTSPAACMQDLSSGTFSYGTDISEDCLFLNVFTPAGVNITDEQYPVMVWVYGGSFTSGAVSPYNASLLIAYGQEIDRPIVHVALNYRLGAFGWGVGSGFAENNATNLGLRDIKLALSWVQENIWAFGGDPKTVTVFGESAGAIATSLLFLDPETELFSQAIMESGAPSTTAIGPEDSTWEGAYEALLLASNCSSNSTISPNTTTSANGTSFNATGTSSSPFDCLRALPAENFLAAQILVKNMTMFKTGFVYGPTIDGDLIPESPHSLIEQGKVANKPFITGNNKDEGTLFIPSTISGTTAGLQLLNLLEPTGLSNETFAEILRYYPNDTTLGSPFDTGNETFGLDPSYKQFAAILGDAQFQAQRRYFLRQANQNGNAKTWTYQFEQPTPGSPGYLGVYHASEIPFVYGAARPGIGQAGISMNYTEADGILSNSIMEYWLNFAHYADPNGPDGTSSSNATYWPAHNIDDKQILRLMANNVTVFTDDYREEAMTYFVNNPTVFNQRRSFDF